MLLVSDAVRGAHPCGQGSENVLTLV
jgi:hypothetical protein